MTDFVTSADGTALGFDRYGTGPAVILVGGAMQHRALDPMTGQLAERLADAGFCSVDYDRRGRGESRADGPFTLADEIDDLRALVGAVGGEAALYGSSSGGAICLAAAAAGVPVTGLALWEVPLGPEGGTDEADFLAGLRARIESGPPESVIEFFMSDMPPDWLAGAKQSPAWPQMVAVGPSLAPDSEALAWTQSAPRAELWSAVTVPVLALVGTETMPLFPPAAASIAAAVADGRTGEVLGARHSWDLDAMVATLSDFFRP